VTTYRDVSAAVRAKQPGDVVSIVVKRGTATKTLTATLGTAPSGAPSPPGGKEGGGIRILPGRRPDLTPGGAPLDASDSKGSVVEVEAAIPGGRVRVSVSAPGLFMTDELARRMTLTEKERAAVEAKLALAREGLAKALAGLAVESAGKLGHAMAVQARREAERIARDLLAKELPTEKVEALAKFQKESEGSSSVSIVVETGSGSGTAESAGGPAESARTEEDKKAPSRGAAGAKVAPLRGGRDAGTDARDY
jgi:hypothetical protein